MINIILTSFLLHGEFKIDFKEEIEKAVSIQNRIESTFQERIKLWDGDYELCSSIIFPELVRSSIIREKVENFLLLNFYNIHGSSFGNKSVGTFQMKPSFIEKLERELQSYESLRKFDFIWEYPQGITERQIREIRSNRLLSLTWQMDYLIAFVNLLDEFNNGSEFYLDNLLDKEEKIAMYAASYNSGNWFDSKKIIKSRSKKLFPYGNFKKSKYCYSDISVYFYLNHLK